MLQELPVNPPRGRHDTRQKGVCGALPVGICLAVRASSGLEELVDIGVAQLPVAADVPEVVAAEPVGRYQMPVATNVGILDEEVSATCLAVGLPHRRNVGSCWLRSRYCMRIASNMQSPCLY